jgi:GNAT superfamily N-acetyltransferase
MNVVIEPLTAARAAEAVPLLGVQLAEHGMAQEARALHDAVAGLVQGRGAVLLATRGTEAVGVAVLSYTWTLEHGGQCAWLDELYVAPAERGSGLGTALLDRAIAHAKSEGCRAIDLEVDIEHARAEHLYERRGFYRLPRQRFAIRLR